MSSISITSEQAALINEEFDREFHKFSNNIFWNGRFCHWYGGNVMTITKLVLEALAALYGCQLILAAINPIGGALLVGCSLYLASRTIRSLGINEMEEAAKKILGEISFESIPVLHHDPEMSLPEENVNLGIMRMVKGMKTTHLVISYEKSKEGSDTIEKQIDVLCFEVGMTPSSCSRKIKYIKILEPVNGIILEYLIKMRDQPLILPPYCYKLLPIQTVN